MRITGNKLGVIQNRKQTRSSRSIQNYFEVINQQLSLDVKKIKIKNILDKIYDDDITLDIETSYRNQILDILHNPKNIRLKYDLLTVKNNIGDNFLHYYVGSPSLNVNQLKDLFLGLSSEQKTNLIKAEGADCSLALDSILNNPEVVDIMLSGLPSNDIMEIFLKNNVDHEYINRIEELSKNNYHDTIKVVLQHILNKKDKETINTEIKKLANISKIPKYSRTSLKARKQTLLENTHLTHLINEDSNTFNYAEIQKIIKQKINPQDKLSKFMLDKMSPSTFGQIHDAMITFCNSFDHVRSERPEYPHTKEKLQDYEKIYYTSFNYNMGKSDAPVIYSLMDFKNYADDKNTIIGVTLTRKDLKNKYTEQEFINTIGLINNHILNKREDLPDTCHPYFGEILKNFSEITLHNMYQIIDDLCCKNNIPLGTKLGSDDLVGKKICMSLDQADDHNVALKIDFTKDTNGILNIQSKIIDSIPKKYEDRNRPFQHDMFTTAFPEILKYILNKRLDNQQYNLYHNVDYSNQQIAGYCTSLAQQTALEGIKIPQTREDHVYDLAWTRGRAVATKKIIDECEVLKMMLGEDKISVFKDRLNDIKMAVTADIVNIHYTEIPYHHYGNLKPSEKIRTKNKCDGSEYLDYLERVNKRYTILDKNMN